MPETPSTRSKIVLAFLTLYLVWGSTYLAIRVGVHELPPALFAAARWLIAGVALCGYARWRGERWPQGRSEWTTLIVTGLLFVVGGNGLVVWGEQWIPSNLAALLVATTALWIAGFGARGRHGVTISAGGAGGLAIGFVGVALLLWPGADAWSAAFAWGVAAVLGASLSWAFATHYARVHGTGSSAIMVTAIQALTGGTVLFIAGIAADEPTRWQWNITGMAALAYLTVFGTVGFLAYAWLMHRTSPAKLGTYAYVNPAVAVLLGWWLLDEALRPSQWAAMVIIVVGVGLVTRAPTTSKARR